MVHPTRFVERRSRSRARRNANLSIKGGSKALLDLRMVPFQTRRSRVFSGGRSTEEEAMECSVWETLTAAHEDHRRRRRPLDLDSLNCDSFAASTVPCARV